MSLDESKNARPARDVFNSADRGNNKCPLCTVPSGEARIVRDYTGNGELSIRECRACGIAWQWPLDWSVSQGTAFFDERYGDEGDSNASYFDGGQRAAVARLQMDFVAMKTPIGGALLDVGAGIGAFVKEAASRGWQALGIDLSQTAVKVAQGAGVNVIQGDMKALAPDQQFDAISMWDVIEHLDEPLAVLSDAFKRLRAGGWLFVETGNYQSASLASAGREWWIWQADHRWYYSPQSLTTLLERMGFLNIDVAPTSFRPHYDASREPRAGNYALFKAIARHPWRFGDIVSRHMAIRQSWSKWPRWAHLPIFALAAQKPAPARAH